MKSGPKFKIFKPIFLKNAALNFSQNFCVERGHEGLSMCKFWGKLNSGKNLRTKFSKISLGGPDPQTTSNIPTWLGTFVGGIDPRPTVSVNSCCAQSFPRNWGSKKNLWRHLASKPEGARSRDSTCRRGSTGSTLCQNLGIFGQPVFELWDVEVSVEFPHRHKCQIAGKEYACIATKKIQTTESIKNSSTLSVIRVDHDARSCKVTCRHP